MGDSEGECIGLFSSSLVEIERGKADASRFTPFRGKAGEFYGGRIGKEGFRSGISACFHDEFRKWGGPEGATRHQNPTESNLIKPNQTGSNLRERQERTTGSFCPVGGLAF